MKLNLGCGRDVREGWVNVDLHSSNPNVMKVDLSKLPLPFETESVDEIRLQQVLEHLSCEPLDFMVECHRILKKGGKMMVGLPPFSFTVQHLRGYHSINYMDLILRDWGNPSEIGYKNEEYKRVDFRCEQLRCAFKLKYFLRRLYELVRAMGSGTIEWELQK